MVPSRLLWIHISLFGIVLGHNQVTENEPVRCAGDTCAAEVPESPASADVVTLLQPKFVVSLESSSKRSSTHTDAEAALRMDWGSTYASIAFFALCAVVVTFTVASWLMPHLSTWTVSCVVCFIYVSLSVSIDLTMAMQKTKGGGHLYAFNPICTVILTESVKLLVSGLLLLTKKITTGQAILPPEATSTDVKWLSLPAALFTLNNILVFVALGSNDTAAFGIFRDTVILWTAAIWWYVFRAHLGSMRVAGIGVVFLGLVLNRAGGLFYSHQKWSWQFLWVLFMTLSNAAASVMNEFALKRNAQLDINLQNAILYTMCIALSFCLLAFTDSARLLGGPASFFQGFTASTCVLIGMQSLAGLLVSRLLKYTDSVTKSVAACLRGPTLVLLGPAFVASPLDAGTVASSFTVASGCFIYLTQGPLATAGQKAEDAESLLKGALQEEPKPPETDGHEAKSAATA